MNAGTGAVQMGDGGQTVHSGHFDIQKDESWVEQRGHADSVGGIEGLTDIDRIRTIPFQDQSDHLSL